MKRLVVASLLALCACPASQPVPLAGKSSGSSQADSQKKVPLSGTATATGKAK